MELSFNTKTLREVCEINKQAIDSFGLINAIQFQTAVADLWAAPTIEDIPSWTDRTTIGDQKLIFKFGSIIRIEIAPNHVRNPKLASGELDWQKVSSIKILKVEVDNVEQY